MNYEDYYVEVAIGDVSSRNQIIPHNQVTKIIDANIGKEFYRSMFLYKKDVKDHVST